MALRSGYSFRLGLALCFVLDLAKHAVLMLAGPVQPWGDSALYWNLGADAAGGDFWLVGSQIAYRTPVYPWFLGLCQFLFGRGSLLGVVVIQHGLELATSMLVAAIVWNRTRSPKSTLAAYGWCVALTARCLFANTILTETLAVFLATLFLWLVIAPRRGRRSRRRLTGAAICLGVAMLERPAAVAFLPALIWAAIAEPNPGFGLRIRRAALGLTLAAAVIAPWCVRNAVVWGRFSLTVFLGRELWTATFSPWPGAGLDVPKTGPGGDLRDRLAGQEIDLAHNWSVGPALARQGLNDVELDERMQTVAVQAIAEHPWQATTRTLARCVSFWYVKDWDAPDADAKSQTPWRNQIQWSNEARREWLLEALRWTPERFFPVMWLWSGITFAGLAMLLWLPAWRRQGILLGALLLGPTALTAALEIPNYRYRCIVEPITIVTAIAAASAWARPVNSEQRIANSE
jgi:hypothetical protein